MDCAWKRRTCNPLLSHCQLKMSQEINWRWIFFFSLAIVLPKNLDGRWARTVIANLHQLIIVQHRGRSRRHESKGIVNWCGGIRCCIHWLRSQYGIALVQANNIVHHAWHYLRKKINSIPCLPSRPPPYCCCGWSYIFALCNYCFHVSATFVQ